MELAKEELFVSICLTIKLFSRLICSANVVVNPSEFGKWNSAEQSALNGNHRQTAVHMWRHNYPIFWAFHVLVASTVSIADISLSCLWPLLLPNVHPPRWEECMALLQSSALYISGYSIDRPCFTLFISESFLQPNLSLPMCAKVSHAQVLNCASWYLSQEQSIGTCKMSRSCVSMNIGHLSLHRYHVIYTVQATAELIMMLK